MIVDHFMHWKQYQLGPAFAEAMIWLTNNPKPNLGKYQLDICHLEVFEPLMKTTEIQYEAHNAYADIHVVISGSELIQYAYRRDLNPIIPFDSDKDVGFFIVTDFISTGYLNLLPRHFAIMFPQDAHIPNLRMPDNASPLIKCVVKIPMQALMPYLTHANS